MHRSLFSLCLMSAFGLATPSPSFAADAAPATTPAPAKEEKLVANPMTAITTYVQIAYAAYGDAYLSAKKFNSLTEEFAANPTEEALAILRRQWIAARKSYLVTEGLRFYDGPIDVFSGDVTIEGPESRLNSWPINPGYIDTVNGKTEGGLIASKKTLAPDSLREENQVKDDRDVATGFHAIEFLLWGLPDKNGNPTRTAKDFQGSSPAAQRRLVYLQSATEILRDDLLYLRADWSPTDTGSYTRRFILDQKESITKILTGLATLSGYELPGKHLGIASLDGRPPALQSPYSRTSRADLLQTVLGIRFLLLGEYGPVKGIGIIALVEQKDPALAKKLREQNDLTVVAINAIPAPMEDTILGNKPNPEAVEKAKIAAAALVKQAKLLVEAGKAIGVPVEVTGD